MRIAGNKGDSPLPTLQAKLLKTKPTCLYKVCWQCPKQSQSAYCTLTSLQGSKAFMVLTSEP